jgi:hypothetical protein
VKVILTLLMLSAAAPGFAQTSSVTAEPVAVGLRYLPVGGSVRAGVEATAGPQYAVNVNDEVTRGARSWAGAYATVQLRSQAGVHMSISPAGVALVIGDDYAAAYPSAQLGVEYGRSRVSLGTLVRVIRVPTADSNATYWTRWIPLRVSYALE